MGKISILAILSLFAVAVGGCDLLTTLLPGRGGPVSRDVVVVREGSTAPIPDGTALVSYLEKLEESRCPRGVECIRAGEARVHMALVRDGMAPIEFRLSIPGFVHANTESGHQTVEVGEYEITLLDLSPYPDATAEPVLGESVATLRVVERVDRDRNG